ncbi:MAG: response regulator [Desulfofustis sp. PB-SRB1]|jgi:two-component system response regulator CpxR|nr:response regulator [Desulfofustis sp. PB-SRB1]MBM1001363.1 response regulator [Desulfofustis sp. PB-SRB1]HBH28352.1 response regulator [Desulfofustis sp.]HBH31038.1 response regulator [Desulfofustis sp.]
MSSIALFPCSFTPAAQVTESLVKSLGLTLYNDEDLIRDTCKKYDIDPVTRVEPKTIRQMIYQKTSVFNQFTLEKEIVVNKLKTVLYEKLESQDAYLFYGFHALLIHPSVSHILKVLVVDNKSARIEWAMGEGLSAKKAEKAIRNDDISAFAWVDFIHQTKPSDRKLYDLVLPVKDKTEQEITEEITKRFHTTSVLRTAQSKKAITDMVCAVRVERILLCNGHKLAVTADDGIITLSVNKSVTSLARLTEELVELAQQVAGVEQVKIVQDPSYDASIYRKQRFGFPSKVLFVDDEKEFVQTVSQRLISRDVGTYGVYNGEDALELVTEDRPDVMVLDLKMPGLHGVEVLRRTKEIAPEVEVIILTGHGTSEDMEQCMKLGAFAYMNKPVNIEELSASIKKAYERIQHREAV